MKLLQCEATDAEDCFGLVSVAALQRKSVRRERSRTHVD
jgi:hypothetical protein